MGVKGLSTLLKKYAADAMGQAHISAYAYQKVAVDTSLYMFKYRAAMGDRWLSAFVTLITCLRRHKVHPVFIFDTKAPEDKDEERRKRAERRERHADRITDLEEALARYYETGTVDDILTEAYKKVASEKVLRMFLRGPREGADFDPKYVEEELDRMRAKVISITEGDFRLLKDLLRHMGVQAVQAPGEAEAHASYLCAVGHVDAVLTEDSDVLAYGCPRSLSKLDVSTGMCTEVHIGDVYRSMGLSYSSFVDLCILCGTDYNTNMKGVGPEKAYKLITTLGNLEAVERAGYPVECLRYQRVRELFRFDLEQAASVEAKVSFCERPDMEKLHTFLVRNNVRIGMDAVYRAYEPAELVFED